ncbi:MAG: hypothetical protein HFH53_00830 [Hespellia sp.]|nr:hypothetical protein [Hespellia sp.]
MKKSIINFFSLLIGVAAGIFGTRKMMEEKVDQSQKISDKYLSLFLMMNQWVKVKQEGKHLASYFERNGYRKIAIYGMSYVGKTLANELAGSAVEIGYGIDQNVDISDQGFEVVPPGNILEPVDVIVVTPITFFEEIAECLGKESVCPIVSLEDILYEI